MMNQKFGDLFMFCPEAGEVTIVAAHPAVGAVFAAEVRDFDNGAHKNFFVKPASRRVDGPLVQGGLRRAVQGEFRLRGKISMACHGRIVMGAQA